MEAGLAPLFQCGEPLFECVQSFVHIGGGVTSKNAFAGNQSREVLDALAEMFESLRDLSAENVEFVAKDLEFPAKAREAFIVFFSLAANVAQESKRMAIWFWHGPILVG
jgi:hypothetical protein